MSLLRWNPFNELEALLDKYQQHGASPRASSGVSKVDWQPSVDISETDQAFLIKAELPEVKKEDIRLDIDHGVLTLRGERHLESEDTSAKHHRVERFYGSFMRSFNLPTNVVESDINADFEQGVLKITLPKSAPQTETATAVPIKG